MASDSATGIVPMSPKGGSSLVSARKTTNRPERASNQRTPRCSWAKRSGRRCRRWTCPACRLVNAHEVAEDVLRGLEDAIQRDLPARFITLTDSGPEVMHLADFNRAFSRLCSNLARVGLRWDHHLSVVGCNPDRGHLHRHVVTIGGPYIPQAVLSKHALRVGLGSVVHIRRIGSTAQDRARIATYVADNAVAFAVAHANTGARIAPISRSRGR